MEPRSFNRGDVVMSFSPSIRQFKLQWSHGRLTVVTGIGIRTCSRIVPASMEPRSFNRGDKCYGERVRHPFAASMEPRSFNRGDASGSGQFDDSAVLQWSHGRLTVVTWGELQFHIVIIFASMEPRSFNRGDDT